MVPQHLCALDGGSGACVAVRERPASCASGVVKAVLEAIPLEYRVVHQKYKSELYGILVSLTTGEARSLSTSISDLSLDNDGFVGMKSLQNRYDAVSTGSLLQAYLEVVAPPPIKRTQIVSAGYSNGKLV